MSDRNSIPDLMDFAKSLGPLPDNRYKWVQNGRYGRPSLELHTPGDYPQAVVIVRGYDAWYYGPTGRVGWGQKSVNIRTATYEEGMRWGYTLLMLEVTYEK